MKNIVEKFSENMSYKVANEIDDYAQMVFKIPKWLLKRKKLLKFYAWFFQLNIEQRRNVSDLSTDYRFFRLKKKVGEKKIRDINLI